MSKSYLLAIITDPLPEAIGATDIAEANGSTVGLVQVTYSGAITGTVAIQGRLSPTDEWVTLGSPVTADAAVSVALFPQMRATADDAADSGSIVVQLLAGHC